MSSLRFQNRPWLIAGVLGAAVGCGNSGASPSGTGGSGAIAGAPGSGGAGGSSKSATSGLPEPATSGVARPAGTAGSLTVLNWAGFAAAVSWTAKYLRVTVAGGTLAQGSTPLVWDDHGFYEVALDAGMLTLSL